MVGRGVGYIKETMSFSSRSLIQQSSAPSRDVLLLFLKGETGVQQRHVGWEEKEGAKML